MSDTTTTQDLFISSQTQVIHTTKQCSVTRKNHTLNLDTSTPASELAAKGYRGCKRCGADLILAQAAQAAQVTTGPEAEAQAQEALAQVQDEVLATVHPITGESEEDRAARHQAKAVRDADLAAQEAQEQAISPTKAQAPAPEDMELAEAPSPQQVTDLAEEDPARAAEVQAAAAAVGIPTRATWKQHGNPTSGWLFFGTAVKTPASVGIKVAKVEVDPQGITLMSRGRGYQAIEGGRFGSATKFWAVVPAEATRQAPAEPKAKVERTVAEGRVSAADRLQAALAGDQAHAPAPEGYEIRWPKGGYDLLKRTDQAPEGSPAWLVRCNAHGTTTPNTGTGKAGDALGTKAGRLGWCSGCQADAKAQAQEEAKAAKAKAKAETKAQADQAPEEAPSTTQA